MRASRAKPHTGRWNAVCRRRSFWLWLWLGSVWVAGIALYVWPFAIDDAFIVARYATRIARGASFTFNDGPPTDGVTGPLWLLPLVVGARCGADPLWVAKLVGWLCCAAACVL